MSAPATLGRRERNKSEKAQRIMAAAADLFAERGFDGVTTQAISERADVAAGTLFRYAPTKSELFLMVYNEEFKQAIDDGQRAARAETDPSKAICAMVEPILTRAGNTRNAAMYQRELLFGPPDEPNRAAGLELVVQLEARIVDRLTTGASDRMPTVSATLAARSVFAVLNLLLVQPFTHVHPDSDAVADLRAQVTHIVRGYLSAAPTS